MKDIWGRPLRPGDFVLWSKGNDHWDVSRIVQIDPARNDHDSKDYRPESAVLVTAETFHIDGVSSDIPFWDKEFRVELKGSRQKHTARCTTPWRLMVTHPDAIPPKARRVLESWGS